MPTFKIFSQNRWLTRAILFHVALIPVTLGAMLLDPRTLDGAFIWVKPFKFAISNAAYLLTFAWLLTLIPTRKRWLNWAASATAITLMISMSLGALQAIRGVHSHFNYSTAFDAAVFGLMGVMTIFVVISNLILAFNVLRRAETDTVLAWGLRMGLLASFAGMMVGPLMTSPTPTQREAMQNGTWDGRSGAHAVGESDADSVGLPFLNWSMTSGDYRPAHFVGLHGLQVLPLLGFWLSRKRWQDRNSAKQRSTVVITAGVAYLALTGILVWQAARGQSVIAPDAQTILAFALLIVSTGVVTALALRLPAKARLDKPERVTSLAV